MTHFFSRRPIALVLAAVVLILILVLYFSVSAKTKIWHAIPSATALVMEFKGFQRVERMADQMADSGWKDLFHTDIIEKCRQDAARVHRLLGAQATVNHAFEQGSMLSAYSLNDADSLHALFVMEMEASFELKRALMQNTVTQKYFPATFHKHTLYTVWFSKEDRMVVCQVDNLLLFSRFSYLLEESITQTEQRSSWWANRKYVNELNPEAPFRLFLQPEALAHTLQKKVNPLLDDFPDLISQNVEWLGFAWDGLRVSMLAETQGFLGKMSTWGAAAEGNIFSVIPNHTALLVWAGLDEVNVFSDALGGVTSGDFNTFIAPWLGKGLAFAVTEPRSPGFREDQLLFLEVKDSALAMQRLREYGLRQGTLRQETYQTFEVFEFLSPSIIAPLLHGKGGFQNPVCTMLDDYIVFAATRSALEVCIDKYIVNQTLVNTTDCIQLLGQLPQGGKSYLLINSQFFTLLSQNFLNNISFQSNQEDLNKLVRTGFSGIVLNSTETGKLSAQWTTQAPSAQVTQTGILWKTPLAAAVTTAPSWVSAASGNFILVQDVENQLYCLDESGAIRWRRQMEGALLSSVQGVGIPNQQEVYFAFNTTRHIWLLDEKGQDVGRFPLELRSPASNGMIAIDFDKNLKFNYFVACSNGNLYGYDHNGGALPGWNPNSMVGTVTHPVRHFQHDGNDYLIALNSAAQLHVFGRNGQPRFPKLALSGRFASPPQVDDNARTPRIVCFNTQGKAFVCNTAGDVFSLQLGKGTQKSLGVFAPISGDSRLDYAVLQGAKLQASVYEGTALKTAFSVQMPVSQDTIFEIEGRRIGLLYREKRQIFLVDNNGSIHPDFPLAGTGPFVVHSIGSGSKESLLLVGNSNQLYAYTIR
ncbi:MAG: DUF3352 domain-containing protein [Saprospiraceae bacterium]|nr:DUF3352 domain-containing protein [Saprospiraceae bacterium]